MDHSDPWINYITILLENFVFSNFWKNFFLHFFLLRLQYLQKKNFYDVSIVPTTHFFFLETRG